MNCPICNHHESQLLLQLQHTPIYQHPVDPACDIPQPHYLDLEYSFCPECGHAFQSHFDSVLMDSIYTNHYYTPAPDSIGHQFRDEFFTAITQILETLQPECRILEIGSSSGEVLATFKQNINQPYLMGYEPSQNSAAAARQSGIPTRCEFFTPQSVQVETQPYDLIVSRHVIEHIIDFESFWNAIAHIAHADTRVVLETPSLEVAMQKPSISPFHVEHAHVFSAHSLATLAAAHGWYAEQMHFTSAGNMILCFVRDKTLAISITPPVFTTSLQQLLSWQAKRLAAEIGTRKVILWGAGAGGLSLICAHRLQLEQLVDGNPNKQGKKFCGQPWMIAYGPDVIADLVKQNKSNPDAYTIIIGSTFYREIRAMLTELNWQGGIISPYEWDNLPIQDEA